MSTVIAFPMGRVRPVAGRAPVGSADVVIFPGVRIERREFNLAGRLPAPRRKRRAARAVAVEAAAEE